MNKEIRALIYYWAWREKTMSKVNTAVEDNIFIRYLVIIAGMIIACIGINGFIRPAHLLSGGVPGISTAINYLTGMNIGILTFLINIPIFILGFIYTTFIIQFFIA